MRKSASGLTGAGITAVSAAIMVGHAANARERIVTFMVDGFTTTPTAINARGDVTGIVGYPEAGFVRHPDGSIQTFFVSGAESTSPVSINKKGEVVGTWHIRGGPLRSFLWKPDGTLKTFNVKYGKQSFPVIVNSSGTIIGQYDKGLNGHYGFIRAKHGNLTSFECPCGTTFVTGGNDFDAAVGSDQHDGFLRNPDGSFVVFQADSFTGPTGMSNAGWITGSTYSGSQQRGFVRAPDGTITVFDPPDSGRTSPKGVNSSGIVTGWFVNSLSVMHGFIRAADGTTTIFDPEDSTGTFPAAINDRGVITGSFADAQDHPVGFIRYP